MSHSRGQRKKEAKRDWGSRDSLGFKRDKEPNSNIVKNKDAIWAPTPQRKWERMPQAPVDLEVQMVISQSPLLSSLACLSVFLAWSSN